MHKWLPFITLAVLVMACSGCATADRSVTATAQDAGLEVRIYEVFGMDCPGCHGGLEKLVLRIPAVQAADANWEQKQLTVTVRSGADLDDHDVQTAIRKANLTPGERLQ
jgi:copper chaperone CopZ